MTAASRDARTRWRLRAVAGSLLAGAVALVAAVPALSGSTAVSGRMTIEPVDDGCTSPVGVCTRRTLSGSLKGAFRFTASSVVATADSPSTAVVLYTGDIAVTTKDGTLDCKDAGALANSAEGSLASVCTATGGTGRWAGVAGRIRIAGTSTAAGGTAEYEGTLATP